MAYQIRPNNKLSNHFIKKNLRKVEFTFAEDYDCQTISHPNNPIIYPSINASLQTNQHLTFSNCGDINFHLLNSCSSDNYLTTNNFGGDVKSLGNIVSPMSSDNWGIDGDGLTDGQEVNGWTVMMAYQVGDTMETRERSYKTNPLTNQSGSLDSDQDGLSDWTESSIAGLNYNTAKLTSGSIDVSYYLCSDIKATYGWYIDKCVKEAKEEAGTNLTKFNSTLNDNLNSQFNPYIRENIPPIFEKDSVDIRSDIDVHWEFPKIGEVWGYAIYSPIPVPVVGHCWAVVKVTVQDISGVELRVGVLDNNNWKTLKQSDATSLGDCKYRFSTYLDIDYWGDYLIDYKVKVIAIDGGGNSVEFEQKINGLFGGVLEFLASVWNALVNTINAAVDMVMSALSVIFEIMLAALKATMNAIIQPIMGAINSWAQSIAVAATQAFGELKKANPTTEDHVASAVKIFEAAVFSASFFLVLGLMYALLATEFMAKIFMPLYVVFLPILLFTIIIILNLVQQSLPPSPGTIPAGCPTKPEDASGGIVGQVPADKWWSASAPIVAAAFLTAIPAVYMKLALGAKVGGVAIAMALAIASFVCYFAAGSIAREPWQAQFCAWFGFSLAIGGLICALADMLKWNYPVFSIVASLVSITALLVGWVNVLRYVG